MQNDWPKFIEGLDNSTLGSEEYNILVALNSVMSRDKLSRNTNIPNEYPFSTEPYDLLDVPLATFLRSFNILVEKGFAVVDEHDCITDIAPIKIREVARENKKFEQ